MRKTVSSYNAIWLAVFLIATPLVAVSQAVQTGFLDRSVRLGGTNYNYQVFVPRQFDRRKRLPVILALHGGGEYGSDGVRQTTVGLAPAIRRNVERFPALIIFPQAKADGKPGWQLDGGDAAMAALDKTIREFNGDAKRVVLTGLSAGGNGSWSLASRYPQRFAAVVVVCGFVFEFEGRASKVHYPALSNEPDPYTAIAKRVSSLPIWIFHGDADDVVPPDESRRMYAALKKLGASVRYTELPKANHNAWDAAYGNAELIDWIMKQRRP